MNDLPAILAAVLVALPSALALIGCCLAALTKESER